ncbi:MAG: hypothetical protein JOZ81_27500, partial [Chloroflexi bacterium]|nr:hypothetical protein [Chloroflexota bacterium]
MRPRSRLIAASGGPAATGPHPPHILASPPGTSAPIGAINYTPRTNQIHAPGILAPVDELNYSLLPADTGMGMGQEAGERYGTAPPGQQGRYSSAPSTLHNTFAPGQPPLSPRPYGTGSGPRNVVSGPGPRGFGERASMLGNTHGWGMGAGQSAGDLTPDELDQNRNAILPDVPGGGASNGGGTAPTPATAAPDTQPQTPQAPAANSDAAIALSSTADQNSTPPAGWHSEGGPNDRPGHPSQLWWVSNDGSKRLYLGLFQPTVPGSPDRFVRANKTEQQNSSTGIDFSTAGKAGHISIRNSDTGQNEEWTTGPDG